MNTTKVGAILALIMIGLIINRADAEERSVNWTLPNQQTALADYFDGSADKSGVLILHGFLQTKTFSTVARLAEGLADADYPVLTPTLSLGLSNRKKSIDCEAIHTHSMASDTAEIDHWVRWLAATTGKPVTLVGHSIGSVKLLAYLAAYPDAPVKKAIFISLIYFGPGPINAESDADLLEAKAMVARGVGGELQEFGLGFCRKYLTTPDNYLSYLEWTEDKVADTARSLGIPVQIVMGSKDNRFTEGWKAKLAERGLSIVSIEGANHFFDREHEFDLLDEVQRLLDE